MAKLQCAACTVAVLLSIGYLSFPSWHKVSAAPKLFLAKENVPSWLETFPRLLSLARDDASDDNSTTPVEQDDNSTLPDDDSVSEGDGQYNSTESEIDDNRTESDDSDGSESHDGDNSTDFDGDNSTDFSNDNGSDDNHQDSDADNSTSDDNDNSTDSDENDTEDDGAGDGVNSTCSGLSKWDSAKCDKACNQNRCHKNCAKHCSSTCACNTDSSGPSCVDDPDWSGIKKHAGKTCAWVAQNPGKRCKKTKGKTRGERMKAKKACKSTCGSCDRRLAIV